MGTSTQVKSMVIKVATHVGPSTSMSSVFFKIMGIGMGIVVLYPDPTDCLPHLLVHTRVHLKHIEVYDNQLTQNKCLSHNTTLCSLRY